MKINECWFALIGILLVAHLGHPKSSEGSHMQHLHVVDHPNHSRATYVLVKHVMLPWLKCHIINTFTGKNNWIYLDILVR